jgi:hypothetical protein
MYPPWLLRPTLYVYSDLLSSDISRLEFPPIETGLALGWRTSACGGPRYVSKWWCLAWGAANWGRAGGKAIEVGFVRDRDELDCMPPEPEAEGGKCGMGLSSGWT